MSVRDSNYTTIKFGKFILMTIKETVLWFYCILSSRQQWIWLQLLTFNAQPAWNICLRYIFVRLSYVTSDLQRWEPTLWLDHVQERFGPCGSSCTQSPDPALGCIHHSLQQGNAVFGGTVGVWNHLARRTDQGQVAHSWNNSLGQK